MVSPPNEDSRFILQNHYITSDTNRRNQTGFISENLSSPSEKHRKSIKTLTNLESNEKQGAKRGYFSIREPPVNQLDLAAQYGSSGPYQRREPRKIKTQDKNRHDIDMLQNSGSLVMGKKKFKPIIQPETPIKFTPNASPQIENDSVETGSDREALEATFD